MTYIQRRQETSRPSPKAVPARDRKRLWLYAALIGGTAGALANVLSHVIIGG